MHRFSLHVYSCGNPLRAALKAPSQALQPLARKSTRYATAREQCWIHKLFLPCLHCHCASHHPSSTTSCTPPHHIHHPLPPHTLLACLLRSLSLRRAAALSAWLCCSSCCRSVSSLVARSCAGAASGGFHRTQLTQPLVRQPQPQADQGMWTALLCRLPCFYVQLGFAPHQRAS